MGIDGRIDCRRWCLYYSGLLSGVYTSFLLLFIESYSLAWRKMENAICETIHLNFYRRMCVCGEQSLTLLVLAHWNLRYSFSFVGFPARSLSRMYFILPCYYASFTVHSELSLSLSVLLLGSRFNYLLPEYMQLLPHSILVRFPRCPLSPASTSPLQDPLHRIPFLSFGFLRLFTKCHCYDRTA